MIPFHENEKKILKKTEQILSEQIGFRGSLSIKEIISSGIKKRNAIIRCDMKYADFNNTPKRVIIKIHTTDKGYGYNEQAGVLFLNSIPSLKKIVPHIYGIDRDSRMIIMEDLQESNFKPFIEILSTANKLDATRALLCLAKEIGTLNAETFGKEKHYNQIRSSFPFSEKDFLVDHVIESLRKIPGLIPQFVSIPIKDLKREINEVISLFQSSSYKTYTSGDICPTNIAIHNNQIKIIDYEMGDYRHPLIDGSFGAMRHLACSCANRIPLELQFEMNETYRSSLSKGCEFAKSKQLFNEALISACIAWTAILLTKLPTVYDTDRRWGNSTVRNRIVQLLFNALVYHNRYPKFKTLKLSNESLLNKFTNSWDIKPNTLPLFPAFLKT